MAEGGSLRARLAADGSDAVSLDEAIRLIEAGKGDGLRVDLGGGRYASANTARGIEGLLQRLRGHKMLLALSADPAVARLKGPAVEPVPVPAVREILDAATRKA
jgi:hypothetical protein